MESPSLQFPQLTNFGPLDIQISSFINASRLSLVLGLFFMVYLILSVVLMYHWSAYGMRSFGIFVGEAVFTFVSIVLFALAFMALTYF